MTLQVKDAGGNTVSVASTLSSGVHTPHHIPAPALGTLTAGQTVAGVAPTALIGSSTPLTWGVQIRAVPTGGEVVYVGGSGVSVDTGYPLTPGGEGIFMPLKDLSLLFCRSAGGTGKVAYVYG